jgi:hypothetical protein
MFTLIGDVVGSRQTEDRGGLQRSLSEVLRRTNKRLEPRVALEPTIGDEFQGCFDDVATAVWASLVLRLELLREAGVDSRYGLGVGKVETFVARDRVVQDGPGWWTAREAIGSSEKMAGASGTAFARTWFSGGRRPQVPPGQDEAALNAFLLCRDAMVDRMKPAGRNRLHRLMLGWSQARIAEEEGTTQGAVSQSLARSGAYAILASQRTLDECRGR